MAGRQDQNGTDEKGLFGDFSVSTVIASGLAAATSFALSSKIGLAGSIIGVAIGGVASAAASQIYKSLLKASAQKLSDLTPDATPGDAAASAAEPGAESATIPDATTDAEPAADETRVYRPAPLRRLPIQEVAASGTPIAPASVRYAAHERERRALRRRATAIAAAFAIAAVLLFALVVNVATQGAGIGSGRHFKQRRGHQPHHRGPRGPGRHKADRRREGHVLPGGARQEGRDHAAREAGDRFRHSRDARVLAVCRRRLVDHDRRHHSPNGGSQGSNAKQDKPSAPTPAARAAPRTAPPRVPTQPPPQPSKL